MKLFRHGWMIAAVLAAGTAAAQQPGAPTGKIGYVDPQRVMQQSSTTRKAKQALDDKFQKRSREIGAGAKDQVERRMAALEQDLNVEREDGLRQFVDSTNRIIRRIATELDLDAVVLSAAFSSTRIDLTARVVKELDSGR